MIMPILLPLQITKRGIYFSCSLLNLQVVAATNRVDILDPALLRSGKTEISFINGRVGNLIRCSGRLDRKIEFPHPTEEARARIMQIHSRKMNVSTVRWRFPV